eukprot:763658-Hanusia_phi.AAC.11
MSSTWYPHANLSSPLASQLLLRFPFRQRRLLRTRPEDIGLSRGQECVPLCFQLALSQTSSSLMAPVYNQQKENSKSRRPLDEEAPCPLA